MSIFLTSEDIAELVFCPSEDDVVPTNAKLPEGGTGMYMLFSDAGRLEYIGKSICMHERIYQHWLGMKFRKTGLHFSQVATIPVSKDLLAHVEIAHIHALRPPKNVLYETPTWAHHGELVLAVNKKWSEPEWLN